MLTAPDGVGGTLTYTYDNEGNRITKTGTSGVTTYAYDQRDRLTGVTVKNTSNMVTYQATYTYDALDRRIGFNTNGAQTWTVYDGQDTYADFNGSGVLQKRYLYGPAVDALLASTDATSGTTSWYLADREGSVRNLASTSGTLTGTITYDGFGKVLSSSGVTDRFGYTGRESDATTGLQFNRARYYDAALGRWTQEDPIGFGGGDASLTRYAGNGPTNFTDPSGLEGSYWESFTYGFWRILGYGAENDYPAKVTIPVVDHGNFIDEQIASGPLRYGSIPVAFGEPNQIAAGRGVTEVGGQFANFAVEAGITVGAVILPGPEDLVVAGLMKKWGLAAATRGGKRIFTRCGEKLTEVEAKAFAAEYNAAKAGVSAPNNVPKGGEYGKVRSANNGGEVHHMPAAKVTPYTYKKAPASWMDTADHRKTASWGSSKAAEAYRQQQKNLIDQGRLREAIQMDIDDIRSKFGNKYDSNIQEMLDSFRFSS